MCFDIEEEFPHKIDAQIFSFLSALASVFEIIVFVLILTNYDKFLDKGDFDENDIEIDQLYSRFGIVACGLNIFACCLVCIGIKWHLRWLLLPSVITNVIGTTTTLAIYMIFVKFWISIFPCVISLGISICAIITVYLLHKAMGSPMEPMMQ